MDEKARIELIRLMARFKLHVRRQLNQTVDLQQLESNPSYAKTPLREIEEAADDEDLLVMVLSLRELLIPKAAAPLSSKPNPIPGSAVSEKKYMFGARS